MSIAEELLAKAKGNKVRAATELVIGVMAGDPETFKLGYSIGNALMTAIAHYNLTAREEALVVEEVVDQIGEHHSATRRPLVVVEVGGGLVQNTIELPGLGTPEVKVLDYDLEGADEMQLTEMIERIEEVCSDFTSRGYKTKRLEHAIAEYRQMIADGESPGRYR